MEDDGDGHVDKGAQSETTKFISEYSISFLLFRSYRLSDDMNLVRLIQV
jgi:hypothetical protein